MAEPNTKTWADGSTGGTPITAAELNRIEALLIKGIGGSAVLPPASPNARDDEFDGTSAVTWANALAAPAAWDVNTALHPNRLHLKATGAGGYPGKVQSAPTTFPYTITTRVLTTTARAAYHRGGGIILVPAGATSTTNIQYFGTVWYNNGWLAQRITAAYSGTYVSQTSQSLYVGNRDVWYRVTVNSATSVDSYWSLDGASWAPIETGLNPGAAPGSIGLAANDEGAGGGVDATFDFFRVT